MRVVCIVQARMNSNRLPGKVLMPLVGKPVLEHILDRLSHCKLIDEVVIATSTQVSDESIVEYCIENKKSFYRGSLEDVLDRYYKAAKNYKADAVVRITGDCPLIDPVVVDAVILGYLTGNYDLYGLGGEFPDGLDCTVFSFAAITKAWKDAHLKSEREHVGPYIENNPDLFSNGCLKLFFGLEHYRWTLDELDDYKLLVEIFSKLYNPDSIFLTNEIIELMKQNPHLIKINQGIIRNEGYYKSVKDDLMQ
jgi:spore coat polysaccharide biosynthesis protein SpsF (cytidylyltransferase family)